MQDIESTWGMLVAAVSRAVMVLSVAVLSMLMRVVMTRTEREKRMELRGTGIPMITIWSGKVSTNV